MGLNDFFRFGKHKGESLRNVMLNDAQYVIWCITTIDTFNITEIYQKALMEQYEEWTARNGTNKPFKTCDLTRVGCGERVACCPVRY